jgi:tripartite-type tricarboxylate transporter receptor subunit TctC
MLKSHFLRSFLAACAVVTAGAAQPASAQTFPTQPMTLFVPFSAGSTGDITSRVMAKKMGETLGQTIIVENRPSAGGIVATTLVAKAKSDGYQLLLYSNTQSITAALFNKLPYDSVQDFQMIGTFGSFAFGVLVPADSPFKTLQEFIAAARLRPGALNIATVAVGTTQNLTAQLLKSKAGIDTVVVPYNASGDVLSALRGHHVDAAVENMAVVAAQIKSGSLRALAVSTADRYALLPDIPTVAESGIPGFDVRSWNGIAAPRGVPAAVVDRLNKTIRDAIASPEVVNQFNQLGAIPYPGSPDDMRKLVVSDIAKWTAVIEEEKIPKQ